MQSFHIAGYVFTADTHCCDCIANWAEEELKKHGYTDRDIRTFVWDHSPDYEVGVFAHRSEVLLKELGAILNIDIEDYHSFDSDHFPKVIFADQIHDVETDYCGTCGEKLP